MIADKLIAIRHILIRIEKIIAASSLILLLAFALIQIVARNFFTTGFPALEIISRHLVLFITFMGAALISENNEHIKIDVLAAFLSEKQKQLLARPLLVFSIIVCAFFAWYSIQFWLDEWNYAAEREKWILYFALILPIGFSVLSLHMLLITIGNFEHHDSKADA